jgi:hypothetical protein
MVTAIEAEVGAADLSEFDRAMIAQQVALAR